LLLQQKYGVAYRKNEHGEMIKIKLLLILFDYIDCFVEYRV